MGARTPMTLSGLEPVAGLTHALTLSPHEVIAEIKTAAIRGRGGAGFPSGIKWELAASAPTESGQRYVICNADEGEPGTFKDRVLLDEVADVVFDGMTIAGYAIGSTEGIVYLRAEYSYLLDDLEAHLQRRREQGLLGENIAGKAGFTFDIHVHLGAGAYMCGEETALIASLEGMRGEAKNRPPYPVTSGLHGAPTVVNNVETFAWAAAILSNGADWFAAIGTSGSTGPKLLSVSGDVERPGVYEFPLGIPIADVLAAAGGSNAKAAIIGGAAGQCVPAKDFDRKIAYEDLATGGAVIVIGPERNMADVVENIMEFFADESCGQCTPCRIGNVTILDGIRDVRTGTRPPEYIDELVSLGHSMRIASKCGLGQSSPNVFISIVDNFRSELTGQVTADV